MKSVRQNSILLTFAIFTQMNGAGFAQNQEAKHSLEPTSWSLQFQISNNFTLSSFQGSVLSAKYHSSRQRAFRFGLALSGTFQDRKQTNQEFTDDNMRVENTSDDHSDLQSIDLITQYIFYSTPKRMNFYSGIGPIVATPETAATVKTTIILCTQQQGGPWDLMPSLAGSGSQPKTSAC